MNIKQALGTVALLICIAVGSHWATRSHPPDPSHPSESTVRVGEGPLRESKRGQPPLSEPSTSLAPEHASLHQALKPESDEGAKTPTPLRRLSSLWPGARLLETRESDPLDGLITRVTLLQPNHFPYPVYVREILNTQDAPEEQRLVRRSEMVASHLLIKLRPGRAAIELEPLARSLNARLRAHPTAPALYFLELPDLTLDGVSQAQAILAQYPELIEYAEPDAIVRAAATSPNDPRFSTEQWGLQNTGQAGGTADVDIDAPEAWDIRREATNVVVAVVDSGVRYTHEDLAANMWRNPGEIPGNGLDDDGNGFVDDIHGINAIDDTSNPDDDVPDPVLGVGGHGTSVAGVIGAVGNNGLGIAGVAWKVQIMALKWFNNQGAGALSDAIQCLDYARSEGAAIVNASWQQGGLLSGTVNQSMMDALERLRQAGILFVSSAGNDAANNDLVAHFPSNYPFDNMVAVAAGTRTGSLSRQSNFGERLVDVVAPGEEILTTASKSDTEYAVVSGTSFAAPHVSGILAILKAHFPSADYRTLINRLLSSADRRDRLVGKVRTGAFVNLFNALSLRNVSEFPQITTFTLNGQPVGSLEEVSVLQGTNVSLASVVAGATPLSYSWKKDGKAITGATSANLNIPSFAAGDIGEYQLRATNPAGAITVSVKLLGVVSKPEVAAAVNATNRTFLSSGNALWEGQRTVTRDGLSAGASGKIVARQATLAATTVVGPGKASFMWKVSSERNNDTLECLIDGVRIDAISGEVDWTKKELQVSAGTHEIRWRYLKDSSLSKGADKGYLDLFTFTADAKSAPTITAQPITQSVLEGSPAFLSVVAAGSVPLSYQWLKDGTNIVSARSNRLDFASASRADEGRYSVIVSNEAGIVTSATARLTVTPIALPPRITSQPTGVSADEGGSARFSVAVSGTPPLRYQWQKAGTALQGQTNASLALTNLSLADAGNYSVVVSNGAGQELSRSASLAVVQLQLAPTITKQASGQSLAAGQRLELAVEVKGLGPFSYQWIRNGQPLPGETKPELVRPSAQAADAGKYQVRVSSPFGVTLSGSASVIVTVSSPPLAQAVNNTNFLWTTAGDAPWFHQTKTTFDGLDALQSGAITNLQFSEVTAEIIGPGQISFWWKVSSEFGYDFLDLYVDGEFVDGISGEWGWEEILWNVGEGTHTVTWRYSKDDDFSAGADAAWLDQVAFVSFDTESPVVAQHPVNQSGLQGGSATFEAYALGSPPLRFQWFKGETPLPGATSRTLTLSGLAAADEAAYSVTVSNRFGVAISREAFLFVFNESEATDFALDQPGLSWTNYLYASWYPQVQTAYFGDSALRSGPIGDAEVAWLGSAVVGPGILYYSWKVSSEQDYDFLEFLLDDQLYDYISGEVDWQEGSALIPPGIHFIDFVYLKDAAIASGDDAGWLDQVSFVPLNGFSYWQQLYFNPSDLIDPQISGPEADADFDGIANELEYAFGLDPQWPDQQGLPSASLEGTGPTRTLAVTYRRRTDDPSLTYQLETSTDLQVWTPVDATAWVESVSEWDEGIEEVRASSRNSIPRQGQAFYRVRFNVVEVTVR
ncbi:MAG: immunoglobulin domain-containing protein [Verrucomicrobiales bacterium]|nr:immunoglobulin domain-containing protein [Verrucomicrobiales bacterium]